MYAPNHRAESRFLERQREMRENLGTLSSSPAPFRSRNPRIYKWPDTPQILEWAAGATSTTRITNLTTERLSRLGRGGLTPLFHPAARAHSHSNGGAYAMDIDDDGSENVSMTSHSGTRIPLSQRSRRPSSLSSRSARGARTALWPQVEDEIKRLQADFEHDLRVTRIHFSNHYNFMELGLYNLSKQVGGLQRVLEQNLERAGRADPREREVSGGIGVRKRREDRDFEWPDEVEMARKRREISPEDEDSETEAGSGSETVRSSSDGPAPRRGGIGEEQGELSKHEAMNRMIRRAAEKLRRRSIRETQQEVRDAFLNTNANAKEMGTQTPEPSRSPPSPEVTMPGGYPKSVTSTNTVEEKEKEGEVKKGLQVWGYGPNGKKVWFTLDPNKRFHDLTRLGIRIFRDQRRNPFRGDDEGDLATRFERESDVPQIKVQPTSPPKMTHDSMDYYKMHLEAAELRDEMHQGLQPEWYDTTADYPRPGLESIIQSQEKDGDDDDERRMTSGGPRPEDQWQEQVEAEKAASLQSVEPGPEPRHPEPEEDVVSVDIPALRQNSPLKPLPTAETVTVIQTQTTPDKKRATRATVTQCYESLRKLIRNFCHSKAINLGPCNKNLNSTSLGSREFPFASTYPTSTSPDLVEGIPSPLPSLDPQVWNKYSKTLRDHIIMAGIHQILWDTILAVDDETIQSYYSAHWDVYSVKIINWIYYSLRPVWNQWVFLKEDNGDEDIGKIKAEIMNFVDQAAWLRYSVVEDEVHPDNPRHRPSFMLMVPDVETAMRMETEGVWEDFFIQKGEVEDIEVTFSDNSSTISGRSSWTQPNLITGNYDFTFVYPALMEGRLDITTGLVDNREVIGKGWVLYKTKGVGENEEYESHTETGEDDGVQEEDQEEVRRSGTLKKEVKGKGKEKAQPPRKERGRKGKSPSPSPSRGAENEREGEGLKPSLATRRGRSPSPIGNQDHGAEEGWTKKEKKKVSWAEEVEEVAEALDKAPKAKSKSKGKTQGKQPENQETRKETDKARKEREKKEREEALQKKKATESYQFIKRDLRKDQRVTSNRHHAEVVAEKAARAQKKKEKMREKMREREAKGGQGPAVVPVLHSLDG